MYLPSICIVDGVSSFSPEKLVLVPLKESKLFVLLDTTLELFIEEDLVRSISINSIEMEKST
jgi:hypothetical protein